MTLDLKALVRAAVVVVALAYVVCFVFVAIAPGPTMALFASALHTDLSGLPVLVTGRSFVTGLLFWSGLTAIAAWLTAWIYNRSVRA